VALVAGVKGQFSLAYSESRSGALELRRSTRSSLDTLRLRRFRGVLATGVDAPDDDDDDELMGGLMIHCCGCCSLGACVLPVVELAGRGDDKGVERGDEERGEVENEEKHEQNADPQLHGP
jgi:hypothetical protein